MRNLRMHKCHSLQITDAHNAELFCCDLSGSVYVYSQGYVTKIDGAHVEKLIDVRSYYSNVDIPKLIDLNVSSVSGDLTLAFVNGDILCVNRDSKVIECVGCVDNGLQTVSWSPDEAVVALITQTFSLIIMTYAFDSVAEVDLHDKNFGEKQFITVGWGKKETQFRGSEGKFTTNSAVPVELKSIDYRKTEVSWRGDSQLFAVNLYNPHTCCRCIKIFSHDGVLQYTSEPLCGLEGTISWQPSGAIIVSTQCLPNKYVLVFFEKNGLKHGEFSLPFSQNERKVHKVSWNCESTILAVWWEDIGGLAKGINIYTRNNYHWYLKQVIDVKNKTIVGMKWDSQIKNRLHLMVLLGACYYKHYDFVWTVDHSVRRTRDDDATIAVIDGVKILVTSFRHKIVPPPMCEQEVVAPAPVNFILFSSEEKNHFYAVLSNGKVSHLLKDTTDEWKISTTFEHIDPRIEYLLELEHVAWLAKDIFVYTTRNDLYICQFRTSDSKIVVSCEVRLPMDVVSLTSVAAKNGIMLQYTNGNLALCDVRTREIKPLPFNMPEPCTNLDVCYLDNGTELVFGLSEKLRFYLNGEEVASNITSYVLHSDFILFTTLQHKFYCAPLNTEIFKKLPVGRSVERGSRLVIAVPYDTKVIFQMPRGNLECIHPRPLCLHVIADYLDKHCYGKAFELLRKHRISLNLLCDHSPSTFFSNVTNFVNSVQKQSWLSLFLSELVEEDVTITMYAEFYQQRNRTITAVQNKVKKVCDAVRDAMLSQENSEEYLLPVLTGHVKQHTEEQLAAALARIKAVKEIENAGIKEPAVSSEDAIKHLLYLVDVNELYNVALGTYDFDLVLFVASKSQKDPKEYLPFLNGLRRLETSHQKYTIDKHLKRYKSALFHISRCSGNNERFQDLLTLVKEQKLYGEALKLFDQASEEYKEIGTLYAIYLEQNKHTFDAAVMFQRVGKLTDAVRCFSASGDWRLAIHAANKTQCSPGDMRQLYSQLVSSLSDRRQFADAAEILDQHLQDIEECVAMLVRGHLWFQAYTKACLHNRTDLIETHVKPGVVQHYDILMSQLSLVRSQFEYQKGRLEIVRKLRQTHIEDEDGAPVADTDLFSDTSSVIPSNTSSSASRSSGRSRTSSRRRRKQERKLLSLKEGSPYEDLALIRALHDLVSNTDQLRDEVKCLCKILLHFNQDEEACSLQNGLSSLLELMKDGIPEIWSSEVVNAQAQAVYGPESTVNSITANLQLEEIPSQRYGLLEPKVRIPPVINSDTSWQLNILKI